MNHPGSCSHCGGFPGHSSVCPMNRDNPDSPLHDPPAPAQPRPAAGPAPRGCGWLIVALIAIVAVGGTLYNTILGIVAPDRGLDPMYAAGIHSLVDAPWEGLIRCGNGDRTVAVEFRRQLRAQSHVTADVAFLDGQGTVTGEYRAKGTFDGVRLEVAPDGDGTGWFRPMAWRGSVSVGDVDTDAQRVQLRTIDGDVVGDASCSSFTLNR